MTALWISGASCLITLLGGAVALHLQTYRGLVLAFCAGALVSGALMEVVPDALQLLETSQSSLHHHHLLFACTLGFLCFYLVEHATHRDDSHGHAMSDAHRRKAGVWGAAGIGLHSFFDGVAIGGGFEASSEMGWMVALAVMLHKVADGASAVGIMLATRQQSTTTAAALVVISVAPLAGTLVQSAIFVPTSMLALILGWFAGVFLYLGAGSLLPAAHSSGRSRWLPISTLGGAVFIYLAQSLVE